MLTKSRRTRTRTLTAVLEVTEDAAFDAAAPNAVEKYLQRIVEPALNPEDLWAITKLTVQGGHE